MTQPTATIIEACADPVLFARWFRNLETWQAWFTFMRALFGLEMSDDDLALYRQCTGRDEPPAGGAREAWLIVGRRGGKSLVLALIAVFLACFVDWSPYLSPGERGTVMVIATDRRQARTIFRYIRALLLRVPVLATLVERERRPPFSPDGVVQEFAELLKSYKVRRVVGDRYAGEWPRERFRVHGIEYRCEFAIRPAGRAVPSQIATHHHGFQPDGCCRFIGGTVEMERFFVAVVVCGCASGSGRERSNVEHDPRFAVS